MNKNIWLIGTGLMAIEYDKVLKALNQPFTAIGRSENSANKFFQVTNTKPLTGGISHHLMSNPPIPEKVIISVGIESLAEVCHELLDYGVKTILLEKPGIGYPSELKPLIEKTLNANAKVLLAYNRRFYASVLKAEETIREDGGVKSFRFEFTEWSHVIKDLVKTRAEHENWFLGNSTHVIDTAFFLGGWPVQINTYHTGGNSWHPTSTIFTGSGITKSKALFSYHANWESPGRWEIELLTARHRLIFKPMESLQIQKIGSVAVEPSILDDAYDKEFKPGIYKMVSAFLHSQYTRFCTLENQMDHLRDIYIPMSGYTV